MALLLALVGLGLVLVDHDLLPEPLLLQAEGDLGPFHVGGADGDLVPAEEDDLLQDDLVPGVAGDALDVDPLARGDEDLLPAPDGAIGNWDEFFLGYYDSLEQTGGYYITSWECGEIHFDAPDPFTAGNVYMGDADGYTITSTLSLKKGVNCISLITTNNETITGTTMSAMAPAVDCIEISTTAQLGMYYQNDNGGYGVEACKIK